MIAMIILLILLLLPAILPAIIEEVFSADELTAMCICIQD
jgi:hypothetical protein